MKDKIEKAKEAGFSDEEIIEFISKKDSSLLPKIQKAQEAGHKSSDILEFIAFSNQPSKKRSILSAPAKGALKAVQSLPSTGPIPKKAQESLREQILPTRPEHQWLERAGEIGSYAALGPEGIGMKILQTGGGTLAGELAKELGAGETGQSVAEAIGMGLPGIAKGGGKAGLEVGKSLLKGAKKKFPSGLTQVEALKGKGARLGSLSSERQNKVISDLNQEANKLASEQLRKKVPSLKQIESGHDFYKEFDTRFSSLEKPLKKYNPTVDISPISDFLDKVRGKYKDIPSEFLTPEAKKLLGQRKRLRESPILKMRPLYKIYRANNKNLSRIGETKLIAGSQKEYADFLKDLNRSIVSSFEKTLPEDSSWLKEFKDLNVDFKNFKNAGKVLTELDKIFKGKPSLKSFEKIAEDKKYQKILTNRIGQKEAQPLIELSQNLKESVDALKKIPKKNLTKFDAYFPVYLLIPFAGKAIAATKGAKFARYGLGYYLSSPQRIRNYQKALNALKSQNLESYIQATAKLKEGLPTSLFRSGQDEPKEQK